ARALIEVQALAFIHALRDVRRLLVVADHDRAALVVDTEVSIVVTDALDGFARNVDIVDVRIRRDFAGQYNEAGIAQGFGRYAGTGILFEDGIQDGVGDLISDLVRMTFGDG